ncbi:MAG: hypothetical protein ACOZCO_17110 [Bacteroidota bacterium]
MSQEEIEFAKTYRANYTMAVSSITTCFFPGCPEKSINSHILQKNGILSSIAPDRHLMWHGVDHFSEGMMKFKRSGINEAFSFNCFCSKHDSELFKHIESGTINFNDYKSLLLFTIRTICNEKFRKMVNIKIYERQLSDADASPTFFKRQLEGLKYYEELGLKDLEKIEKVIWDDLKNSTESFVFNTVSLPKREVCMSAFFTYETTEELNDYRNTHGKDKEKVSDIFVNYFPVGNNSIFTIGYQKSNESTVKGFVNTFVKDNVKRLERKISNLLLFRCETWVCSESLYNSRFKKCEKMFASAAHYSANNIVERKFFPITLFEGDLCKQFEDWSKSVNVQF